MIKIKYFFFLFIFAFGCSNADEEYINLVQYLDIQVKSIKQDDFENNISIAQNVISKINIFINKYNDSKYIRELERCKLNWKLFLNNQRELFFSIKKDINNKILSKVLEDVKKNDKYKDMKIKFFDRKKRDQFIDNNNLIIKDEYVLILSRNKNIVEIDVKVLAKIVGNNVIIDNLEVLDGG